LRGTKEQNISQSSYPPVCKHNYAWQPKTAPWCGVVERTCINDTIKNIANDLNRYCVSAANNLRPGVLLAEETTVPFTLKRILKYKFLRKTLLALRILVLSDALRIAAKTDVEMQAILHQEQYGSVHHEVVLNKKLFQY
jgi:hypothetical protein